MFPLGVSIPFTPVPSSAPYHAEGALSFNSRTNIPITIPMQMTMTPRESTESPSETEVDLNSNTPSSSSSSMHSYPPTPSTATQPQPPIPVVEAPHSQNASPPRLVSHIPSSQITQFILTPSAVPPIQVAETASLLSRALSVIKNYHPSRSNNTFTLCRVLHPPKIDGISSPPPPYASNASISSLPNFGPTGPLGQHQQKSQPVLRTPLLTFHDQTPFLTLRSLTGLIELDKVEERTLGVDTSFWIAVALTYLEFLEEREARL